MDITKQNKIDQIMSDFALYLNPDLLKDEYSTIIVNTKFKKEKIVTGMWEISETT